MFSVLPDLLQKACIPVKKIDLYAAGLGPGKFSALRISLTALRAMAMPDNKPVAGIPSPAALAFDLAKETNAKQISIIGDARRDTFWHASFEFSDNMAVKTSSLSLVEKNKLAEAIPAGSLLATPEWDRMNKILLETGFNDVKLIKSVRVPDAVAVARLAEKSGSFFGLDAPLAPIYMHPPTLSPC